MNRRERKYIYINAITAKGAVFQTQVLDWLKLFSAHHLDFSLIHTFNIQDLKKPFEIRNQISFIKRSYNYYSGSLILLPSRKFYYIINTLFILIKLLTYILHSKEIVVFSRGLIGREIALLRLILGRRVLFYYDARGAGGEENRYTSIKDHDFSQKRYRIIGDTFYLEYKTLYEADKVFAVSNKLIEYFNNTYKLNRKHFVLYPCLADSNKFFFDSNLRSKIRKELNIDETRKVYIYSGGVGAWHLADSLFSFFNYLKKADNNSILLLLSKSKDELEEKLSNWQEIKNNSIVLSVKNDEVKNYLNAADYGILFRENSIVNYVAAPTKFAEYILCGLPVLISEGIGDYSALTQQYKIGVLIKEDELKNPENTDFESLHQTTFDKQYVAELGLRHFSKNSIINRILDEFRS